MKKVDKRGKLQDAPFTFRRTGDGRIFIHWHGRQAAILKGSAAERFMKDLTDENAQLLMARVTGNFKRGNEKTGKDSG